MLGGGEADSDTVRGALAAERFPRSGVGRYRSGSSQVTKVNAKMPDTMWMRALTAAPTAEFVIMRQRLVCTSHGKINERALENSTMLA